MLLTLVLGAYLALGALTPVCYLIIAPLGMYDDRGNELDDLWWVWKVIGRAALAIGWPGDVFFWNWLIATLVFREFPRETTFSSRIERHAREGDERGIRWAARLIQVWPGHIDWK